MMHEFGVTVRRILIGVFLIAGVAISSGCTFFNIELGPRLSPLRETVISGKGEGKVLLVDISGVISDGKKKSLVGSEAGMVETIREITSRAEKDEDIKAIWLRINSPGGTVTSSDMIYHELKTFKEKKKIKIYATVMDMAASGGYYIALAGDKIIAHPTSITGSIGVIAMKVNLQGLLEKVGVGFEVVKSGDKKDFLSPLRPFTEEERKLFQFAIDSYHQRFVGIVTQNRPEVTIEALKTLADGRVFNAQQALDAKLIDHIGYLDETEELIKKDLGLSDIKIVTYHRHGDYKSNLYSSLPQTPVINLFNIDMDIQSSAPYFMYLWMP
ncbi:MAG: Signal peptide peptidase SppA [Nitrospinae bacterium RIFCSPLOWO2_12_FULL_47_7]|nr:MAG: Signal peptide peptidase SppA [Nitrospinae bacterium RIFCSPLOWO2_12_FULL_47_7]